VYSIVHFALTELTLKRRGIGLLRYCSTQALDSHFLAIRASESVPHRTPPRRPFVYWSVLTASDEVDLISLRQLRVTWCDTQSETRTILAELSTECFASWNPQGQYGALSAIEVSIAR